MHVASGQILANGEMELWDAGYPMAEGAQEVHSVFGMLVQVKPEVWQQIAGAPSVLALLGQAA